MKKLIALIIVLLLCLLIIVGLKPTVYYVTNEGYVVPSSANITTYLSNSASDNVYLQFLEADSTIYSSLFQDYDYESKIAIDLSYPMYVNGGAGVQFLSDDFWLIADDFNLLETYDGLYLTAGNTYNQDLSLADGDEFLLVALDNGLYMNAQTSVFSNVFGDTTIPANSIISFTSTSVTYFSYSEGSLVHHRIDDVYNASITIGTHTYNYADFVEALGIFEASVDSIEKSSDIKELQQEIAEVLKEDGAQEEDATTANTGSSAGTSGDFQNLSTEATDAENTSGDSEDSSADNSQSEGSAGTSDATNMTESEVLEEEDTESSVGETEDSVEDEEDSAEDEPEVELEPEEEEEEIPEEEEVEPEEEEEEDDTQEEPGLADPEVGAGTGESELEGEGGTGSGENVEVSFTVPEVSIDNISAWAYALSGELNIEDPSAVVRKGVSFTVYGALKSLSSSATSTVVDGITVYGADDYSGTSAKLRKTFYSSQSFTLDGIQPDSDYYIQFSYSYTMEVENEDGETVYTVISVVSDFYQVSTLALEDSDLATILMSYDVAFASDDDRFVLNNFYIKNDSEYDATDTSFENFVLNTLPYFSKFIMTVTNTQTNETQDITITSSALAKAMVESGTTYTSSAVLESNTIYTYTVVAQDKYGNELPISVNDEASNSELYEAAGTGNSFVGTIYTAKAQPTVAITEIENVTDSLTIKLTVSDPDDALSKDALGNTQDLWLVATNSSGVLTAMTGDWDETQISAIDAAGDESLFYLYLKEPADGVEYELTITSLAFARTYTFSVYGDYQPQPDDVTVATLSEQTNVLLGSNKSYTAAIASGALSANVSFTENNESLLYDTSAGVLIELADSSTTEILALVDEFDITVTDTANNEVRASIVLLESELSQKELDDIDVTYDDDTNSILIFNENGVKVELVGEESEFETVSLWEALLVTQTTQDDETVVTKSAVALRITIEQGLESYTSHEITYNAIVEKSDASYTIPISLSTYKFTTKKLTPVASKNDTFIANDIVQFIDFNVYDPDAAVVGTGAVELRLYTTTTSGTGALVTDALLKKETVYASDNTIDVEDIEFTGLTQGLYYIVEVVALAYNNDSGYASYQTNYLLASYTIEAGSDVKAEISLNSLDYIYTERSADPIISYTGEEVAQGIDDGTWSVYSSTHDVYWSEYILLTDIIEAGYNVIELDYDSPTTYAENSDVISSNQFYFYTDAKKSISSTSAERSLGNTLIATIPDTAVYVRILIGEYSYMTSYGVDVYGYKLNLEAESDSNPDSNLVFSYDATTKTTTFNSNYSTTEIISDNYLGSTDREAFTSSTSYQVIYMMPVSAGDIYFTEGNNMYNYVYYYNDQGEYIGWEYYVRKNTTLTIPENVAYITMAMSYSTSLKMYLIEGVDSDNVQYELDADITVYDKKGVLIDEDSEHTVDIVLQKSIVQNVDAIGESAYTSEIIDTVALSLNEDGSYTVSVDYIAMLEPNSIYRILVQGTYEGTTVTLASQELETDGELIMISNASEFSKIYTNPYANFLVTADFEVYNSYSFTFYGTIDFDGHTITRKGESTSSTYLINILGVGGVVKNLVYEIDNDRVSYIVANNYGTIENVMVKTTGTVETQWSYAALICGVNYNTISSFIIELGGDIILSDSYSAIVTRSNLGVIEDGYIYTTNNYAMIVPDDGILYANAIAGTSDGNAVVRNVYSVFDVYLNEGSNTVETRNGYTIEGYNVGNVITNCYHVGDYYVYDEDKGKTTTLLENQRVVNNRIRYGQTDEVWNLSIYEYEPSNSYDDTNIGSTSLLYDVSWQSQVLTGSFDIEGTVSMNYYPRLEWPTCMEQYQAYISLPVLSVNDSIAIVSDSFTEGETVYNNQAYVTFRLENPYNYTILDIELTGLNTTLSEVETMAQGVAEDGLYDVTFLVTVPDDTSIAEYLSAYTVTSVSYSVSGVTRTDTTVEYTTRNIAFYKEVGTVSDWATIDQNMDWNYRLTNDITFTQYDSLFGIIIDGSSKDMKGTSIFYGNIDGGKYNASGELIGYYTISGISNTNSDYPYIIYSLDGTASITNLGIDNLTISGDESQSSSYAGFIRYSYGGSLVENVHFSNASIDASGYVGIIVGYGRGTYLNCTVTDSTMNVKTAIHTVAIGSIGGYLTYANVYNCYAKNVDITATGLNTVTGIGGLVGYMGSCTVMDCYVEGTITSDAQTIGGAIGKVSSTSSTTKNVFTDVEINTSSGNVGGIIGNNAGYIYDCLALGNIYAGTSNTHRLIGLKSRLEYVYNLSYAYEGQVVNQLSSTDNDDAAYLYSGSDLAQISTWVDGIGFGSQWDFSVLEDGSLPILYYRDTTTPLPGQEGSDALGIPGNETFTAELISASVSTSNNTTSYIVEVEISHETLSGESLINALTRKTESNTSADIGTITFDIEGMEMSDADMNDQNSSNYWTYALSGSGSVVLRIETTSYDYALDTYKLTIVDTSNQGSITVVVDYGVSLYHTVANIDEWNDYMTNGHDRTGENFIITGEINFASSKIDLVTNLMLGELKGSGSSASFTNLSYATTTTESGTWITSCKGISDISFSNFTADFSSVPAYQAMGTFIGYCSDDVSGVTLENLSITTKTSTAGSMGFIYEMTGALTDITVSNLDYISTSGTSSRDYTGGVVAFLYGSFANIQADDIYIYSSYANYNGGIVGYLNGMISSGNVMLNSNVSISNVTISGRQYVGGVVGYSTGALNLQNIEAENMDIEGWYSVGGIGGTMYFASTGNTHHNISIRNSSVTSNLPSGATSTSYNTGGIFGYAQYYGIYYDLYAENVTVEGYGRVGGIVGLYDMPGMNGVQVIDCTIIQHTESLSTADSSIGAGGVVGVWTRDSTSTTTVLYDSVVRDTTIVADYNAGGIIGKSDSSDIVKLSNAYVAEDVVVTATSDNAGGVIGYTDEFIIEDIAVGAQVTALGSNAGGVIGYLCESRTTQSLTGIYVRGSVTAADNAGGVIGYATSDVTITNEKLVGVIVAADLTSAGSVDLVANFAKSTAYSSGLVGVWDNLLINGQTAQSIYREASDESTANESKTAMRTGVTFLTATGLVAENETTGEGIDDFLLASTYETYGFTNYDASLLITEDTDTTDTTLLASIQSNTYMPFIMDQIDSTVDGDVMEVLPNTSSYQVLANLYWNDTDGYNFSTVESADDYVLSMTTVDASTGILRPTPGERAGATVVYASGVDTVNIETAQASVTFALTDTSGAAVAITQASVTESITDTSGTESTVMSTSQGTLVNNGDGTYTYTFATVETYGDTYHVLTLGYDYQSTITIGAKPVDGSEDTRASYTVSDLARTVMTYGTAWYYIDATGALTYGTDATTGSPIATTGIPDTETVVHLWQGNALTENGDIYTVGSIVSTFVASSTDATENAAIQISAVPAFDGVTYDVYYNFTIDKDSKYYAYRVLTLGSTTYAVFSTQGTMYDGYVLATQESLSYFYMLSTETQSLTSYLTTANNDTTFSNSNIVQMTNSFGYSGNVAVIKYTDGSVKVWNYATGAVNVTVEATTDATQSGSDAQTTSLISMFSFSDTTSSDAVTTSDATSASDATSTSGMSGTNDVNGTNDISGAGTASGVSLMSSMASFASTYTNSLFTESVSSEDDSVIPADDSYSNSADMLASYNSVTSNWPTEEDNASNDDDLQLDADTNTEDSSNADSLADDDFIIEENQSAQDEQEEENTQNGIDAEKDTTEENASTSDVSTEDETEFNVSETDAIAGETDAVSADLDELALASDGTQFADEAEADTSADLIETEADDSVTNTDLQDEDAVVANGVADIAQGAADSEMRADETLGSTNGILVDEDSESESSAATQAQGDAQASLQSELSDDALTDAQEQSTADATTQTTSESTVADQDETQNTQGDENGWTDGEGGAGASDTQSTTNESEITVNTQVDANEEAAEEAQTDDSQVTQSEYTIAYNPYTNAYEVYATAELTISGSTMTAQSQSDAIQASLNEINHTEDVLALEDDTFKVNLFASTTLSNTEKNGFVLLGFITLCGVAVVILLQVKCKKH